MGEYFKMIFELHGKTVWYCVDNKIQKYEVKTADNEIFELEHKNMYVADNELYIRNLLGSYEQV